MTTHRRQFLCLCGAAGIGALAGCSDGSQDDSTPSGTNEGSTPAETDGDDTSDGTDGDDTSDGTDGDDSEEQSIPKPAEDADPEDLLPDPPEGWEQTVSGGVNVDDIEAEVGKYRDYEDPDGEDYGVQCLRFANEADAEDYEYNQFVWPVQVVNGVFVFEGRGVDTEDTEKVITLMANSSALTENFIRANRSNQ